MKRFLLLSVFCLLSSFTFAQNWTGMGDGSWWFDSDNWNPASVPVAGNTVVIPDGFTVVIHSSTAFANSITVQGNSTLNVTSSINLGGNFTIQSNATVNFSSQILGGTIYNSGTLNLTDSVGVSNLILNNDGTINFLSSGDLNIGNTSTLNNLPSGVIDMQTDSGNISTGATNGTNIFNNEGLIKKTTSTGEALIVIPINNNNGTIQVESGTLSLFGQFDKNLTDGTYNVFSGATLECDNGYVVALNTLQGTIDGAFNIKSGIRVAPLTSATFNFTGNGTVNWLQNALEGGGTLINQSILNLSTSATKTIRDNSTLNNEGTINVMSTGDIIIQDGTINNQITGVLDLQADSGNITYPVNTTTSHTLNNYGLIRKSVSNGEVNISAILNNIDGTISVENGTLALRDPFHIGKNFSDGIYNVFSGATFNWNDNITVSGNLIGTIEGDLNWNEQVIVTNPNLAFFNFTGTGNLNWTFGSLRGGGALVNNSVLNLTGATTQILESTTLDNTNTINFTSLGGLNIVDGFLTNFSFALIDLQADNGNISGTQITTPPLFNDTGGIIRRSNSSGVAEISVPTVNTGFIDLLTGTLKFSGTNALEHTNGGFIFGIGTLDVPQLPDYINDGFISPGLSLGLLPGMLSIEGNFKSSSSSDFLIDLNGLAQTTEHDVLNIQGNATFEGTINITLDFEPSINDEFIIATTTGTITACNITSPTIAFYNGNMYTFDVICRNDNELVLTVVDPLSVNEFENETIAIYPNPTKNLLHIKDEHNTIEKIELISISGQVILKQKFNNEPISLSPLSKGIYFIRLYNEKSFITKKILKI